MPADRNGDREDAVAVPEEQARQFELVRYKFLLDHASEECYLLDTDGHILYANTAAAHSLGYSRDELQHMTVFDIDPAMNLHRLHGVIERLSHGPVPALEVTHHGKDGSRMMKEVQASLLQYEGVTYISSFARDITERKRAEAALRERQSLIDSVMTATPDIIVVFDVTHRQSIYINRDVARLLGYDDDSHLPPFAFFLQILHPDDRAHFQAHVERMASKRMGEVQEVEYRLRDAGGAWHWYNGRDTIIQLGNGDTPCLLLSVAREVTAQKVYEEQLQKLNRALRVLSNINQVIIVERDEERLLNQACQVLVEMGGYRFAWIGMAEQDAEQQICPVAYAGDRADFLTGLHLTWAETPDGYGPTGTAIRRSSVEMRQDIRTDESYLPWRERALAYGYAAVISLPLLEEGQAFGAITLYAATAHAFTDEEVGLLEELAGDVSTGIQHVRGRAARERAIKVLEASEAKFRTLAETAVGIIGIVQGRRFVYINPYAERVSGYTRDELLSMDITRLIQADFQQLVVQRAQLRQQGQPVPEHYEFIMVTKAGDERWIDLSVGLIEFEGQPAVIGIGHDITERKSAEEALARERAVLDSAINLLPFPILLLAADGTYIRENAASVAMMRAEGITDWRAAQAQRPDTRAVIPAALWPVNRALHGEVVAQEEMIIVFPDGHEKPVLSHATPVWVEGELVAVVVAQQDVSALKEADQAKNHFLDVLSHELKTPLTSILGWTQAAEDDPTIVPEALQIIERNAKRQRATLTDLLDISRMLHGKFTIAMQPVDLWQIAEQAALQQQAAFAGAHLRLMRQPPGEPLPVCADAARMQQVLWQLLDNARKFTPREGTVTITGWREGNQALLAVCDSGRGIDPAMLATLFQPFRQIERSEKAGGLGMGLMLVKGIIDLHGGTVQATSAGEGQGSTFTIALPLRMDD